MKRKIFFKSLLVAACLLMGWGSTAWAETGTENATNTGTKDQAITGTSYTIPGTYIAGAGGASAGDMKNKGVKFRTGSDGARLVFNVNSGYKITGFRLYGISNYDLKSGKSEPCISVTKVEVDGTETTQTGTGQFPAKGSSSSGSVILSGINAESTIAISFDNSNAGGTQINGYYELDWETVASNVPLSTTISPSSATVYVGYTTTLTGSFTGGDFEGEWVSSNESVATVSQTGVVTGVAAGTANITYQWKNDQSQNAYKATAAITVATPEAVGTAGTLALDILQYETINLTNVYSFDSNNQILVVSANQIRANGSTQKWMNYKDAGGAQKTWNATGVFKGSAFYNTGSSNNAVALRSGRTFTLRVTNSDEISALVLSGGSSKTTITIQMDIYELDAYGIERVSNTPVVTKSTTSISEAVLTASGLDKTKVYEATFTSTHASSNSYVYEVAFKAPDTRIATSLSFPEATYNAELGSAFTAPTLTKDPTNLEGVVFSSSNTDVAEVNASTGEVTVKAVGEATITATFAQTDIYKASTVSYTLTVSDPNAKTVTATFAFDTGAEGQTAVVSAENVFSVTSVGVADMTYAGVGSDQGITGTKIQPVSSASDNKSQYTKFTVTPKKGITFTPTKVSFDALRWGTDGSNKLHYYAESGSTSQELGNVNPNRNGKGNGWSHYEHELSGINATSDAPFSLACYVYGLANTKQISFANIVIEGEYSGEAQDETMYTITTSVTPDGAGNISQNPAGSTLAEGTAITFTATANTGYKFLNKWTVNGDEIDGSTYSVESLSENQEVVAQFQKLFAVSFTAGEGADKGTTSNVLNTDYVESTYTTPAANYYVAKPGYTVTGWTDGENDYTFGQTITLTADIELQPIFVANEVSLSDLHASDVVVTYNFNPETGAPALNIENATGYYVQQATINGTKIDMPIYINNVKGSAIEGKTGKTNNVSANATTAQINEGSKFTLAAVKGMTVVLTASNNISTTTVGGATPSSGSGTTTATYTYNGEGETVDIVFGNDGRYYSSIVVTYPKKLPAEVTATISEYGYATFSSAYALDFSGVTKLKAYIATSGTASAITLELVEGTVAANTGLVVKGTTANIPVVESGTDYSSTNKLWVWDSSWGTEVGAASEGYTNYVLSVQSGNVVFAPIGSTPAPIKGGQAVLTLPVPSSDARSLSISFADEQITGISRVENSELRSENSIFDLQGRCVAQPTKGLYIKNGKKVFVK